MHILVFCVIDIHLCCEQAIFNCTAAPPHFHITPATAAACTTFSISCWYQSVPRVTATLSQLFTPRDLWLPRFCFSAEYTTIATYRHNHCMKLHGAGLTHFLADPHTYSQTAEC